MNALATTKTNVANSTFQRAAQVPLGPRPADHAIPVSAFDVEVIWVLQLTQGVGEVLERRSIKRSGRFLAERFVRAVVVVSS